MNSARRGFTLIELLVVVAIIGLLVSILLPGLRAARNQAKRVVCASNVRSLCQAQLLYATEFNDRVPLHQGVEPVYVYVRGSSQIRAPGNEWHLGELLMPYMSLSPPKRNLAGGTKFADDDLKFTEDEAQIFDRPSTGNHKSRQKPNYPNWGNPSQFGAYMDYAQVWGWIGLAQYETWLQRGDAWSGRLLATTTDALYVVLDDEQLEIKPTPGAKKGVLFELPNNTAKRKHLTMLNTSPSGEVPMFTDYYTSFNWTVADYASKYKNGEGEIKIEGGNHDAFTDHTSGSGLTVTGGNLGYVDGHVEWRTPNTVKPRLIIDRSFTGGTVRPTYWW